MAADDLKRAQELDSNIVLPTIDFFSDAATTAVATNVMAVSAWDSCRPLIEQELADRGFTEVVFVREYRDLNCAELKSEFDGQPRTVLVTCQQKGQSTMTLPCPASQADDGSETPTCSLLVLRPAGKNGPAKVARFEQEWDSDLEVGEPLIINYPL